MEASFDQTFLSQIEGPQCPGSDKEQDKVPQSTTHVSDADSSISRLNDFGAIGSELWDSAEEHGVDSELYKQSHKFFDAIDWQALAQTATRYRDGIQCSYVDAGRFSVGQFNMVRRLDFVDGVRWVARVRLPPEATIVPLERYDSRRAFDIEVASMKFLKSKSTIPVPEVYVYDHDPSNQVGASYMLIEYIHGTVAHDLASIKDSAPGMFGTPEQDQRFRQQMAKIQAQVLTFRFPKIGSLYYDHDTENFYIGADIITGRGPWASSVDYYRDLTDFLLRESAELYLSHRFPEKNTYFCAPVLLNYLMSTHSKNSDGPYSLVNRDFGSHNILVDNDFNIVGVIDLDGIFASPPEAAAQYPVLSSMDPEPPGITVTNPYALERIERTKPQLAKYKEWLMKYEAELGNGNVAISSLLGSRGAIVYQGFVSCSELLGFQNERWFASALAMLREYAKA